MEKTEPSGETVLAGLRLGLRDRRRDHALDRLL
jgi:hypothetical protein